jgi:hypothetical protein
VTGSAFVEARLRQLIQIHEDFSVSQETPLQHKAIQTARFAFQIPEAIAEVLDGVCGFLLGIFVLNVATSNVP